MYDLCVPSKSAYGIGCGHVRFTAQRGFSLDKTNGSTCLGQCYGTRSTDALINEIGGRTIDSGNVSHLHKRRRTGHWSFMQNQVSNKYVTPSSTGNENVFVGQVEELGRRNSWCGIHEVGGECRTQKACLNSLGYDCCPAQQESV